MFMHIAGTGDETTLASSVGRVFARMTERAGGRGEVLNAAIDPSQTSLDTKAKEDVLGAQGALDAGVYRVVIGGVGRAEDLAKGLRAALDQTRHDVIQAK